MRPRTAVLASLLALAPLAASAQTGRGIESSAVQGVRVGDEAHTALRPHDALEAYEGVLETHPDHYEALWRAAREAVSLGMLAESRSGDWFEEAVGYARRAVEARPDGVKGNEWLAIALGQSALDEGPRTRVRLSEEIRSVALRTLELDSLSAAAHHVLGEWNAEIERLSGVTRWAAQRLLGADAFDQASWENARTHLERAVELEPRSLINHLALARVYLDTDEPEAARTQLREVLDRPAVEPTDPLLKQQAQELLGTL